MLTLEDFADKVGDRFQLAQDDGTVDIELIEAIESGDQVFDRKPFSLLFRAPSGAVPQQQIYRLEHDDLGELDLFLVPISADQDSVDCEAVFS
ncbi:MAG: hypothetical protein MPN21_12245 [Thermoanaerobaculia bacterium]|nr:hypothetical protein [Thermoanaerobaculia bacterium]